MNKRIWLGVARLVLAAAVAARVLLVPPAPVSLAGEATSPPGATLPDGLAVPTDTVQLGPVLVESQEGGIPVEWQVVLAVVGDPLKAWGDLWGQLARKFPAEGLQPDKLEGCQTKEGRFLCYLFIDVPQPDLGTTLVAGAHLLNAPDDVTGRYLIAVSVTRSPYVPGFDVYSASVRGGWPGGEAPDPQPPRDRAGEGDPLAPSGAAYDGDTDKYVLLPGSEMAAHYGEGSITGGFEVLLRVDESADVGQVASAYADRANRGPGDPEERFEVDGTTYIRYPAGPGAGGYPERSGRSTLPAGRITSSIGFSTINRPNKHNSGFGLPRGG